MLHHVEKGVLWKAGRGESLFSILSGGLVVVGAYHCASPRVRHGADSVAEYAVAGGIFR